MAIYTLLSLLANYTMDESNSIHASIKDWCMDGFQFIHALKKLKHGWLNIYPCTNFDLSMH
jgi:hypothetical protein